MASVKPEAPHGALGEKHARTRKRPTKQAPSTNQTARKEIPLPKLARASERPKGS
jgi:hypothetical protein